MIVAVVALAAALLAGCTPSAPPDPTQTASRSPSASSSPTPTPTPTPTLDPEGSAADNLPLFTAVTAAVWDSGNGASGRAYIDALVAAGFDKAAMEVTADATTIGNPAESIQFAVLWGEECLVGQVGPATGVPVTVVVPALATTDASWARRDRSTGDVRVTAGRARPGP